VFITVFTNKNAALKISLSAASNPGLRDFSCRSQCFNMCRVYLPLSILGASSQILRGAL